MADDPVGMFDDPAAWAQATVELASALGRPDAERRLGGLVARARRSAAIVVVAGDHRQGKSSLVNALVGRLVCPFDPLDATTVPTLVCSAAAPRVTAHRIVDGAPRAEAVDPTQLADLVTERGNPGNDRALERVEIGLPAPLLDQGVVLVDLPGGGALRPGLDESALWWCGLADLVVLTSSATAELSASELRFLHAVGHRGVPALVALTRIDHVPRWRAVLDADEELLAAADLDVRVLAVSPQLATVGLLDGDAAADEEAGIASLREVVERAARQRVARARADLIAATATVLGELADAVAAERARLGDPAVAAAALAEVEVAEARVAEVRSGSARWATVLADQLADLVAETSADLKRSLRVAARRAEEAVAAADDEAAWEVATDGLTEELGVVAAAVDAHLRERSVEVVARVAEVIGADLGSVDLPGFGVALDMEAIWADVVVPPTSAESRAADVLTAATSITGGMSLIGGVLHLLPSVVGSLLVASPVVTVAGLAIGGQRIREARRRKRHQARLQLIARQRKVVDAVQQELIVRLAAFQRGLQRAVRDEAQQRLAELARQATAEVARRRAEAGADERARAGRVAAAERAAAAVAALAAARPEAAS